jgi:hypothetical protein
MVFVMKQVLPSAPDKEPAPVLPSEEVPFAVLRPAAVQLGELPVVVSAVVVLKAGFRTMSRI